MLSSFERCFLFCPSLLLTVVFSFFFCTSLGGEKEKKKKKEVRPTGGINKRKIIIIKNPFAGAWKTVAII